MKKQFLVLAGSALILASCGSNENTENNNQQAQIDSIAAANAALQDELNKKANDSAINAMATAKADSIAAAEAAAAAAKTSSKGTAKKKTTAAPPPPPPPPPTKSAQDEKFDRRSGNTDLQQSKPNTEQQKAQDDKFNRRGK